MGKVKIYTQRNCDRAQYIGGWLIHPIKMQIEFTIKILRYEQITYESNQSVFFQSQRSRAIKKHLAASKGSIKKR